MERTGAERAGGDQASLELEDLDTSRPVGRTETAVRAAIKAAGLTAADAGAAEAAAQLARGMDLAANVRRDPYAVAAVGKPLMEQLARLGLDPQARGDAGQGKPAGDAWDQLLEELGGELRPGGQHERHPGPTSR